MRCDYKANAAVTATQVKKQGLAVTPKALPPAPSNHGLTPPPPERGNGLIFVPGMAWPCCAVSPPSGGSQVLRCHRVCLGSSRCYFSVGLETHPVPAPPPAPPPTRPLAPVRLLESRGSSPCGVFCCSDLRLILQLSRLPRPVLCTLAARRGPEPPETRVQSLQRDHRRAVAFRREARAGPWLSPGNHSPPGSSLSVGTRWCAVRPLRFHWSFHICYAVFSGPECGL